MEKRILILNCQVLPIRSAVILGAALAIAAVVTTGGAALIPLLTALGVAAGTAANISLAVAAIAVVSTIGAAALNIADTWGEY